MRNRNLSIVEVAENAQLPTLIQSKIRCLQEKSHTLIWGGDYAFSKINNNDQYSVGYYNCVGLAATGQSPEDDLGSLSFLTHQNPEQCNKIEEFSDHLEVELQKLKRQVKSETVRANLFGGSFLELENLSKDATISIKSEDGLGLKHYSIEEGNVIFEKLSGISLDHFICAPSKNHERMMQKTAITFERVFGFSPRIALDPNVYRNATDAFLSSSDSILYIIRPEQPSLQQFYEISDIPNKIPEWRNKIKNSLRL